MIWSMRSCDRHVEFGERGAPDEAVHAEAVAGLEVFDGAREFGVEQRRRAPRRGRRQILQPLRRVRRRAGPYRPDAAWDRDR